MDVSATNMILKFNRWCENKGVKNTFANYIWWKANVMNKLQFRQHLENKFEGIVTKDTQRYVSVKYKNRTVMEIHRGMNNYRIGINKKFIPEKAYLNKLIKTTKVHSANNSYIEIYRDNISELVVIELDNYVNNFILSNKL